MVCISVSYGHLSLCLFPAHSQAGSDEEDESEDEDYQPQKDEDWKKVDLGGKKLLTNCFKPIKKGQI